MTFDLVVITVIVGIGTYLFRWLPTKFDVTDARPGGPMSRFLSATGPAAITALFIASFMPLMAPSWVQILPVLLGGAATVAGYLWRRDVGLATILGAIGYGLAFAAVEAAVGPGAISVPHP